MAKIVTLGEIMLRLSPEGNDRFIQSDSFRIIPEFFLNTGREIYASATVNTAQRMLLKARIYAFIFGLKRETKKSILVWLSRATARAEPKKVTHTMEKRTISSVQINDLPKNTRFATCANEHRHIRIIRKAQSFSMTEFIIL